MALAENRRHCSQTAQPILLRSDGDEVNASVFLRSRSVIFSLVNAVLLQPLAYKDPQRLFAAREVRRLGPMPVNPVHAREWAKQCPSLEHVALVRSSRGVVAVGGEPASLPGARVAHNFFALFGVEPILGRTFLADEEQEGNDRVVVLSESAWRSRFNADPSLVGVARRRNEIGIRMALGAEPSQLVRLVMRQGMTPVVAGLAAGVAVALALGQAIRGLLFGVQPTDPLTIAGVAVVLLAVGALACLVPAARAARTDAIAALRFE